MKISFAITVCNELEEIKRLVEFLLENKRIEDEIVILFDEKNGSKEVLDFLLKHNLKPGIQTWRDVGFDDNFANWKNKLNTYCTGDFIYQLDADEMISEYIVKNLHEIISLNPEIDLYFVPRINTVEGITEAHINEWGWKINDKGWINFPDYQGRIYRQKMTWYGKVHEKIIGGKRFSILPIDESEYFIEHHKNIDKQVKQNNFYKSI